MSDEWNPQPATLREGETADDDSHAQANLRAIREHERRGDLPKGTFEAAAKRHGLDANEVDA